MSLSIPQLLIILLIAVALFGTKRFKNLGKDVGGAVKDFKDAVKDENSKQVQKNQVIDHQPNEATVTPNPQSSNVDEKNQA